MTQQWDSVTKYSGITLSGSPTSLTATAANLSNYQSCRGTEGFSAGRYFHQLVATFTDNPGGGYCSYSCPDGADPGVGAFLAGSYLGTNQYGTAYFANGTVFGGGGGASIATLAAYTSPCTLDCAIDFNSNLMWFRPSTGTGANLWNNAAIGSQNPAVGSQVGGIAIPSSLLSDGVTNNVIQAIYPAFTLDRNLDTAVAHFSPDSWTTSAPAGFGPFTWLAAINGSDLASLASGSTVLSSAADITNQTALDLFCDISVRMTVASTTFAAQANLAIWLAALLDNGSTYGDGSLTSGGVVTYQLPYAPIGTIRIQSSSPTTLVAGFVQGILIPPGSFRFALGNNLGVALSATAANCVVQYRTYRLNLSNQLLRSNFAY